MRDIFSISPTSADFDGVLAYALICATEDHSLTLLRLVLDDTEIISGIAGDPGWSIDRRKPLSSNHEDDAWPAWAEYRVEQCDTAVVYFDVPIDYISKERFEDCLRRVLKARAIDLTPIEEIWRRNAELSADVAKFPGKYDHPQVYDLLFQEPLRPFRVVMVSGDSYEVRDSLQARLARTAILITSKLRTQEQAADRLVPDIIRVELIDAEP